jgi:hypothetical protein
MFNVSEHIHLEIQLKTIDKEGLLRLRRRFLFISMKSTRKKGIERSLNSSISVVSFNQLQPFSCAHSVYNAVRVLCFLSTEQIASFVITGSQKKQRCSISAVYRGFYSFKKKVVASAKRK